MDELKFNEKGPIPAIVQDHYSKKVLMMAWMNKESLEISLRGEENLFYSRSRQELWRKGETSGNVQHISSIYADCDKDTLIVEVVKEGPACHTGAESCFFEPVYQNAEITPFSYEGLYDLIMGRKTNPKEGSYTTYLFDKGLDKILKKGRRGVYRGYHRGSEERQGRNDLRAGRSVLPCHGSDGRRGASA